MKTKDIARIALCVALMAVCSWISIPSAVPFTLQTMAVFLSVSLLGGKRGCAAVAVYLALGALGLPVFSGFRGGIGALAGSTGGYIVGFLGCAGVMWALQGFARGRLWVECLAMLLGLTVCYAFGTGWFMWVYARNTGATTVGYVLSVCVVPFMLPDIVKIAAALFLSRRLRNILPNVFTGK